METRTTTTSLKSRRRGTHDKFGEAFEVLCAIKYPNEDDE